MKYQKKPITVEAVQWTGSNRDELRKFVTDGYFATLVPLLGDTSTAEVYDKLHGTWIEMKDGDWVIKGVKGEFYPVAADVFAETYEEAA